MAQLKMGLNLPTVIETPANMEGKLRDKGIQNAGRAPNPTMPHKLERNKEEVEQQQAMLKKVKSDLEKPVGLLAVHIKEAKFLNIDPDNSMDNPEASVYMRILAGNQTKMTCVYDKVSPPTKVIFDDLKHFQLRISPNRNDVCNNLRIKVIAFDEANPQRHRLLSVKQIHLYEIIKKLYMVETYEMWNPRIQKLIAEVNIEFCFAYGSFGYGYSNQFENRQKAAKDQLTHSMFFREEPPLSRQEGNAEVLTSMPVGHPAFINFTRRVELGSLVKDLGPSELHAHEWRMVESPTLFIARSRKHMHTLQQEFSSLHTRRDRIKYLRQLITGQDTKSDLSQEYFEVPSGMKLKRRQHQSHISHSSVEEEEVEIVQRKRSSLDKSEELEAALLMLQHAPGIRLREMETGGDSRRRSTRRPIDTEALKEYMALHSSSDDRLQEESSSASLTQTSDDLMPVDDTLPRWQRRLLFIKAGLNQTKDAVISAARRLTDMLTATKVITMPQRIMVAPPTPCDSEQSGEED